MREIRRYLFEKVAANPEDMGLTRKVFGMLSAKKCTDSDFFLALLEKVLNDPDNPPTAKILLTLRLPITKGVTTPNQKNVLIELWRWQVKRILNKNVTQCCRHCIEKKKFQRGI